MSNQAFSGVASRQRTAFEAYTESADLFSPFSYEKATKKAREASYRPINLNSDGPFDFYIPHEGDLYLNPSTLRLHGTYKVVKLVNGKETVIDDDDKITPVNLSPLSFFQSLEIDFQGQIVSFISTPLHHYKSYIETILSYDKNSQETHLAASRWNSTPATRKDWIKGSKAVDFSIDLHSDLASTEKFWPNKLDINIRLNRAPSSFSIIAEARQSGTHPTYKIIFTDLILTIDKVLLDSETLAKHEKSFNSGSLATYPFSKTVIKTKQIGKDLSYAKIENLFMNELPNSCVVAMVDSDAFNGGLENDPFKFEHFNLSHIQFDYNSEIIPPLGIDVNFKTGKEQMMRAYRRLFDHTGVGTGNITNAITPELFKTNMCLFPVDFTPDRCLGYHTHLKENGTLGLELKFSQPLAKNITVLVFATFDDYIQLDRDRQVVFRGSNQP